MRFIGMFSMVAVSGLLVGCATVEKVVSSAQLLPQELPQGFRFDASADRVWETVHAYVRKSGLRTILVENPKDRFLSFSEHAENWRDLGQDVAGVEQTLLSRTDPFTGVNQQVFKQMVEQPGEGTAITTIWVEESVPAGSQLHIRRVYYGEKSFPGLAHSRGDYERDFFQKVQQLLAQNRARRDEQ